MTPEHFSERLLRLREERGFSRSHLAEVSLVGYRMSYAYEMYGHLPGFRQLVGLAAALDCDIHYLATGASFTGTVRPVVPAFEAFGARLARLRKERGCSKLHIAEHAGIAVESLPRYESGRVKPGCAVLLKLANYFQVSLDYLILGE